MFKAGLILDTFEHYEGLMRDEQNAVNNIKSAKALLMADYAQKLIEVELFPKAEEVLRNAGQALGEIDRSDV